MIGLWKNNKLNNEILGINERNMDYVYRLNPKANFSLADDKIKCKEVLHVRGIACAETYGIIKKVGDIPSAMAMLNHHQSLAIKPANGSGGGGILILKKDEQGSWLKGGKPYPDRQLYTHLARIIMGMFSFGSADHALIEECIEPHPFFAEIYPAGVPDFRVILLRDRPVMCMLRVPTDRSDGKANLHQGGLGIGIDMQNGTLKQGYDGNAYYDVHPDNGCQIQGKNIPMWEDLLALSIETSEAFPLDYLGIDIVIDKMHGPMIMEINVRPGLGIQLANKQGLKSILNQLNHLNK